MIAHLDLVALVVVGVLLGFLLVGLGAYGVTKLHQLERNQERIMEAFAIPTEVEDQLAEGGHRPS